MHRRLQVFLLILLLFFVVLIWHAVFVTDKEELSVTFLNVGQGDAVFIESPSGIQVLIDGGPNARVLRELNHVMPFFDRSIDVILATHPDKDHIGGLIDVLEAYDVEHILISDVVHETDLNQDFGEHVVDEGAVVTTAKRGQVLDLGEGAYLRILFPDRTLFDADSNEASIVMQLVYGETEFLLSGDAPQSVENYVASLDSKTLESEVLKVGHHGSRTSSSELFVGWVQPEYGVVSRGCENRYGHPHSEVVDVFDQFEVELLDTCEDGSVTFTSDGQFVTLQ